MLLCLASDVRGDGETGDEAEHVVHVILVVVALQIPLCGGTLLRRLLGRRGSGRGGWGRRGRRDAVE
jgi:hypothetical protein